MMSKFLHYIFDKDLFAQRIIGLLILIGTIAACCIFHKLGETDITFAILPIIAALAMIFGNGEIDYED